LSFAYDHKIPTIVDPKEKNFFSYKSSTIFKPNKREIEQALECEISSIDDLNKADTELRNRLNHKISFITLSEEGIYFNDGENAKIIPPTERVIADVCGAGDGVLSIVALAYLKNLPLSQIGELSNIVGGQICEKVGVAPAILSTLITEWEESH